MTGDIEARCTMKLPRGEKLDFNKTLTLFSPISKEGHTIYPHLVTSPNGEDTKCTCNLIQHKDNYIIESKGGPQKRTSYIIILIYNLLIIPQQQPVPLLIRLAFQRVVKCRTTVCQRGCFCSKSIMCIASFNSFRYNQIKHFLRNNMPFT